ncbi:MAG: hypothetical protein PVH88_18060 [Ignavibacteria bacterium]|jgi:hypothetical protein
MALLIKVEKLRTGMTLAAPIMNRYGQVLLNSGVELMPRHSRLFKIWGIKVITIKDGSTENQEIVNDDLREKTKLKFDSRLLWEPENPLETDLYEVGLNKTIKDIISKYNHEKSQ